MAMQKCVLKLPGLCSRSKFRSGLLSKQIPQLKLHGTRALSEEGLRGSRSLKPTSASGSSQEHKFSKMEFESDKVQKDFQSMISDEIGEKFNKISQELAALGAEIKAIHNQTKLCPAASGWVIGTAIATTIFNLRWVIKSFN